MSFCTGPKQSKYFPFLKWNEKNENNLFNTNQISFAVRQNCTYVSEQCMPNGSMFLFTFWSDLNLARCSEADTLSMGMTLIDGCEEEIVVLGMYSFTGDTECCVVWMLFWVCSRVGKISNLLVGQSETFGRKEKVPRGFFEWCHRRTIFASQFHAFVVHFKSFIFYFFQWF